MWFCLWKFPTVKNHERFKILPWKRSLQRLHGCWQKTWDSCLRNKRLYYSWHNRLYRLYVRIGSLSPIVPRGQRQEAQADAAHSGVLCPGWWTWPKKMLYFNEADSKHARLLPPRETHFLHCPRQKERSALCLRRGHSLYFPKMFA